MEHTDDSALQAMLIAQQNRKNAELEASKAFDAWFTRPSHALTLEEYIARDTLSSMLQRDYQESKKPAKVFTGRRHAVLDGNVSTTAEKKRRELTGQHSVTQYLRPTGGKESGMTYSKLLKLYSSQMSPSGSSQQSMGTSSSNSQGDCLSFSGSEAWGEGTSESSLESQSSGERVAQEKLGTPTATERPVSCSRITRMGPYGSTATRNRRDSLSTTFMDGFNMDPSLTCSTSTPSDCKLKEDSAMPVGWRSFLPPTSTPASGTPSLFPGTQTELFGEEYMRSGGLDKTLAMENTTG